MVLTSVNSDYGGLGLVGLVGLGGTPMPPGTELGAHTGGS